MGRSGFFSEPDGLAEAPCTARRRWHRLQEEHTLHPSSEAKDIFSLARFDKGLSKCQVLSLPREIMWHVTSRRHYETGQ